MRRSTYLQFMIMSSVSMYFVLLAKARQNYFRTSTMHWRHVLVSFSGRPPARLSAPSTRTVAPQPSKCSCRSDKQTQLTGHQFGATTKRQKAGEFNSASWPCKGQNQHGQRKPELRGVTLRLRFPHLHSTWKGEEIVKMFGPQAQCLSWVRDIKKIKPTFPAP